MIASGRKEEGRASIFGTAVNMKFLALAMCTETTVQPSYTA